MREQSGHPFDGARLPKYQNAYEFRLPGRKSQTIVRVIATTHDGWDHVSVTVNADRCPTWAEMEAVKRTFFKDDETAMQLHVPPVDHINIHPYCLHLWRPNDGREIPRPPASLIP